MKIANNCAQPAFSGSVIMNRAKIAKAISRTNDNEQAKSLVENINALKKRLEDETPETKIYTIDFSEEGYKSNYIPSVGRFHTIGQEGTITVSDENFQEFGDKFILNERRLRYGYWDENKKATNEDIALIFDSVADAAISSSMSEYDKNSVELSGNAKKIFDKLA